MNARHGCFIAFKFELKCYAPFDTIFFFIATDLITTLATLLFLCFFKERFHSVSELFIVSFYVV